MTDLTHGRALSFFNVTHPHGGCRIRFKRAAFGAEVLRSTPLGARSCRGITTRAKWAPPKMFTWWKGTPPLPVSLTPALRLKAQRRLNYKTQQGQIHDALERIDAIHGAGAALDGARGTPGDGDAREAVGELADDLVSLRGPKL